jgi:4-amino-4-deoxy-L-arabinose transferase-like glycosyltransferase
VLAAAFVLIVGAGLAVAAALHLRSGLEATWEVSTPAGETLLGRTVERRPWFPSRDRPVGAVLAHWDFHRLGVPAALPPIRVRLSGSVEIPPDGLRLLPRASGGPVRIRVDGRPIEAATVVTGGTHALDVEWRVDLSRDASLRLDGCPPPVVAHGAAARASPDAPDADGPGHGAREEVAVPGAGAYTASARATAFGADAAVLLSSALAGEPCAELPISSLRPPAGRSGPWTFVAPLAVAVLASALAALVFAGTLARDRRRGRMLIRLAAGVGVTAIGAALRSFDYAAVPFALENDDWLFATWNGWQLLTDGRTRGWTSWPDNYAGLVSIQRLAYFDASSTWSVIQPYLEHPPLLHLLVGAAAKLGGADHWLHVRLAHARLVPVALGSACVPLVVAIGRRLYPRGPAAMLAGLIYATLPFVVLQAREVKEEALVVPLALASLLFFLRWRDGVGPMGAARRRRRRELVLAALCAGLAPLAKVPAAAFVPALVLLVLAEPDRPWRQAALAAAVGLGVASSLVAFGAWQSWELFTVTMRIQSSGRPSHWNIFTRWFDDPLVNFNLVGRGWLLGLWVMFAGSVLKRGRRAEPVLTVPLLAYMVAISISSGNWTFGWYGLPLYPLLCLGAGAFLADLWEAPDLWRAAPFWLLLVMYGFNFLAPVGWQMAPEAWPVVRRQVNLYVLLGLVPFALAQVAPRGVTRTLARLAVLVGLGLYLATAVHFVVRYDALAHSHTMFDRQEFFDR